ncbi:LOW QUALITY PROTEIN: hypothetical protein V1477_002678 [Vespula maculifrons]|uniref:Uncharacterized protein n=1 Tax=Vespula maculifrons TaxID=7453 RepID=A0ABD2CVA2_VESMC
MERRFASFELMSLSLEDSPVCSSCSQVDENRQSRPTSWHSLGGGSNKKKVALNERASSKFEGRRRSHAVGVANGRRRRCRRHHHHSHRYQLAAPPERLDTIRPRAVSAPLRLLYVVIAHNFAHDVDVLEGLRDVVPGSCPIVHEEKDSNSENGGSRRLHHYAGE